MAERHPLDRARRVAEALVQELAPVCERIEIAGSIRRRAPEVKDIEIVAVPGGLSRDLFGVVDVEARTPLDDALDRLMAERRIWPRLTSSGQQRMGRRYKALEAVRALIAVDLFVVLPPAQWGAILAIRTGPGAYSERLVTECQRRGLRCVEGRLVAFDGSHNITTPEERDFIEACGLPYAEPWERA